MNEKSYRILVLYISLCTVVAQQTIFLQASHVKRCSIQYLLPTDATQILASAFVNCSFMP